jgi:hypothetical protein
MALPVPVVLVLGVVLSAHARLNAVILGQQVSVSALDLLALALVLGLVIALLWVARTLIRDGLQLKPAWAGGAA